MKNKKITFFIIFIAIVLSGVSIRLLNQNPITFFVLKNELDGVKIFKVDAYLGHQPSIFEKIPLSAGEVLEANKILTDENVIELETWAKRFGYFHFVIGIPKTGDDLNSLESMFFSSNFSNDSFTNLGQLDKIYLSMVVSLKLSDPHSDNSVTKAAPNVLTPLNASSTPTLVKTTISEPIVRVEILNGCGIKGAADWLAKRISNQVITAKNGGNADNFAYASSLLISTADISLVLDKVLKQLGFLNLTPTKSGVVPAGYDAVLIVGKDFQKIKGK